MTPTVRQALAQCGLVPVDAKVLLAHVLECNRAWLAAHETDGLTQDEASAFAALCNRRRAGEPVAYLTGTREFWGLTLAVTPDVLIPRPETETLVEFALSKLPRDRASRVLDLGTGSGAIALALAHDRPDAEVLARAGEVGDRLAGAAPIAERCERAGLVLRQPIRFMGGEPRAVTPQNVRQQHLRIDGHKAALRQRLAHRRRHEPSRSAANRRNRRL